MLGALIRLVIKQVLVQKLPQKQPKASNSEKISRRPRWRNKIMVVMTYTRLKVQGGNFDVALNVILRLKKLDIHEKFLEAI